MGFGGVCGVNWPRDPLIHIKFRENGVGPEWEHFKYISEGRRVKRPLEGPRAPWQGWAAGVQAGPPRQCVENG